MEVVSLACNECGAPLSLPRDTKFATCNHCGTPLTVRHTDDASYTEVLGEISDRTARIESEISELRRNQRVAEIDREWEREREQYMIRDKRGRAR